MRPIIDSNSTPEDLQTVLASLDGLPDADLAVFMKSMVGQDLIKALKEGEETHSAEELHEHPSVHTEGGNKAKWHEAVNAATQNGKKPASYALAQYIMNKMEKGHSLEDIYKSEEYKTMDGC